MPAPDTCAHGLDASELGVPSQEEDAAPSSEEVRPSSPPAQSPLAVQKEPDARLDRCTQAPLVRRRRRRPQKPMQEVLHDAVYGPTTVMWIALLWLGAITVPALVSVGRMLVHPHSALRMWLSPPALNLTGGDEILCSASHYHTSLASDDEAWVYHGEQPQEERWWEKVLPWLGVLPTAWGEDSPLSMYRFLSPLLLPNPEDVRGPRIYTLSPAIAQRQKERYTQLGPRRFQLGLLRPQAPVDCIALSEGEVQATLSHSAARKMKKSRVPVHVLPPGHAAYPGFHDAHVHLLDYGWSLTAARLNGCESTACITQRLEEHVRTSSTEWLEGLGWDQTLWSPAVFPTWRELDTPTLRHRKIVLRRVDVHALWVSKPVIDLLQERDALPPAGTEISGGLIVRDVQGQPTGVFVDKAMDLVYAALPAWSNDQRLAYLAAASERLLSQGITSVGDAATSLESVAFLSSQDAQDGLPLRVYAMLECPLPSSPAFGQSKANVSCSTFKPVRSHKGGRLAIRSVKLFGDGALGSWGAAMWAPYDDYPDPSALEAAGMLLLPEHEIQSTIRHWNQRGFQVNTHCIGDKCNSLVLDAHASLFGGRGHGRRHRMEHAQLVRPKDLHRFGELGVIASMQPLHYASDKTYVLSRIGSKRAEGAYAWHPIIAAGGRVAFGSDVPVEDPDVLRGFSAAIKRSTESEEQWHAHSTLSRGDALAAFTREAAYSEFADSWRGALRPGTVADITIVSRDIVDPRVEAHEAKVVSTVLDGRTVSRADW